jgi:hypothetical protein
MKDLNTLTDREIILGLMLMLEEDTINVSKLVNRIGYKAYKKFDKAYMEAFKIIENDK